MRNYDFSFSDSYLGYWSIPEIGNGIPGTLYVEKFSVRLELFWNDCKPANIGKYKTITGYAYPADSTKKTCYYFVLKEIYLNFISYFGKNQSLFKFDVGCFFISDKETYDVSKIYNTCIRTQLLDKWVWDYTCDSFEYDFPIKSNKISMAYEPHKPLTLFENNQIRVYLHFGSGCNNPNEFGYSMSTHTFLNVLHKQPVLFEESLDLVEYIYSLFCLLYDNYRTPEFLEFRSEEATFIYRRSPQSSYNFINVDNSSISSSIEDFLEDNELQDIISKWLSLSNSERYAIETYFETIRDEHIPPSSSIKSFISVIEGLSENLNIPTCGQTKGTQKELRLKELLDKTQGLSSVEKNEIKMLVTRESSKQPKLILKHLLGILSKSTKVNVETDFCEKVVNTRNFITHANISTEKIYTKNDYWDVSYALENTIASFLLMKIGVKADVIQKIIPEIKCKPCKSI